MDMPKKTKLATAALGLMLATFAAQAAPLTLNFVSAQQTSSNPETIQEEQNGQRLSYHLNQNVNPTQATLDFQNVGDSRTFNIGTLVFNEPDAYGGISEIENERYNTSSFIPLLWDYRVSGGSNAGITYQRYFNGEEYFLTTPMPVDGSIEVVYQSIPVRGLVSDPEVDWFLNTVNTILDLGQNGVYEFHLNPFQFTDAGEHNVVMTVTLLQQSGPWDYTIPEPGSAALLSLALASLGLARRRRRR